MDKIKRGYFVDSSSSSSEDESYIKGEERVIVNTEPTVKVFTGTENHTRKQY